MADVQELNVNSTTYDIKAKSVVDTNSGKMQFWTGTRAEYDAILSKDANTLYSITDDEDVTLTLLEALYPVGSIYIGTMANCPLATLGIGTWQLKSDNAIVTSVDNTAPCKGNGKTLGIYDGTTNIGLHCSSGGPLYSDTGQYGKNVGTIYSGSYLTNGKSLGITTDATKSGIEATVTSTSLTVNIWERIS